LIPAEGWLVLGRSAGSGNGGVNVDYVYGDEFSLDNSSDEIWLLDANLVEIDRVEYDGSPGFPVPAGASQSLKNPALDNNDGMNWCASRIAYGDGDSGTPGQVNTCAAELLFKDGFE